jgi:hypothetical protein
MKLHYIACVAGLTFLTIGCGEVDTKRRDTSYSAATCLEEGSCGAQDAELLAKQVFNIVKTNCVQCHSSNDAAGGVSLDTFEDLKRFGPSIVAVGLGQQEHPSVDSLPLSETDRLTLEAWQKEGYVVPDGISEADVGANPGGSDVTGSTQTTGLGGKFKTCLCKFLKFWKKSKYDKYCTTGGDPVKDPVKDPAGDPLKDPFDDPIQDSYDEPVKDTQK